MSLPDFTTYTDEDLELAKLAVDGETERRNNLARIPAIVTNLTTTYIEGGGNKTDLNTAVDAAG